MMSPKVFNVPQLHTLEIQDMLLLLVETFADRIFRELFRSQNRTLDATRKILTKNSENGQNSHEDQKFQQNSSPIE